MFVNEILLRRKNKVSIFPYFGFEEHEATNTEKAMVISIMKNIESLGFTFSKELIETLLTYPAEDIKAFYKDLIPKLKKLVGADKEYRPMYPNFPKQVMDASEAELFFNAIIHYFTFGELMPEYEKDERMPLFDSNKTVVLSVGQDADVLEILTNLVESKTSLSAQDKADVEEIIASYTDFYRYLPEEIPLKENVALVAKIIADKAAIKSVAGIKKYFKTATDVLRFVVALSDGDISLAGDTKFRNLKRFERRMVMELLTGCKDPLEDMFRYQYEWIRIGEIVHPFTYKSKRYESVKNAFYTLRNERKPLFVPGKIQECIKIGNMDAAVTHLKTRPGEFARNLDKVLRDSNDKEYVIYCFSETAENVSTPVLLQVRQHFLDRNNNNPIRVFFPKGNLAKAIVIPNELKEISDEHCKAIVKICNNALIKNYKAKEAMGSVYIDEEFKNYLVPFSQRSASTATKTIVRGSNVSVGKDAKAIRAFIWWTNIGNGKRDDYYDSGRVDIDLSAAMFDENWNYIDHVSYTRLRSGAMEAYHSGDITNGGRYNGKGVAEFLDVNINAVGKRGRYIVFQVYNFTGQKFSEWDHCRFGWMEREDVNSGEIFEPSTVQMSLDVNSDSSVAIPVIFDCKERKLIWCDMNLSLNNVRNHRGGNNLESNLSGVAATCYAMTHLSKPNLYDLVMLNAAARGTIVTDRNSADIIFSNDTTMPIETIVVQDEESGDIKTTTREKKDVQIITAYDLDYFMGKMI